jgi:hypothetical protein
MAIRIGIWAGAALFGCSVTIAAAQSVLPPIFGPGKNVSSTLEFPEPKPFGTTIKLLPGQRVTNATAIKGEWFHQAVHRNVVLENERIPQLFTSLVLELQPDGNYILQYHAYWGGVRDSSDPRFAGIDVNETGHFSLSSSILLLRADTIEITRQQKLIRNRETIANENRAYVVRFDKDSGVLNIAGPCTRYQVEPVCRSAHSVWFSLHGGRSGAGVVSTR